MTLTEVANELVAGCREGREMENLDRLYAPDAVSVEGADMGGMGAAVTGIDAIKGKHVWWSENHIMHGGSVEGPFTHGDDRFAVLFGMDVEQKSDGKRTQMSEVAVYHVKDGKIVREEFFYGAM